MAGWHWAEAGTNCGGHQKPLEPNLRNNGATHVAGSFDMRSGGYRPDDRPREIARVG
jgi:hypothetical protein